jgi:thiol-disulfide isomerase/thioredoxin
VAADPAAPALTSRTADALRWRADLTAPPSADRIAISAPEWFPDLPDVVLRLHGGKDLALSSTRGKVLLLDFWASWCAPCLQELPEVQRLHDELRSAGLAVVTVNARESSAVIDSTVRALRLKVPVGVYDDALDTSFQVRALPTVIVADRRGRIRARWDNRVPDFEAEVAALVRRLLTEPRDGPATRVAEQLDAAVRFVPRWTREMPGALGGLAVADLASGRVLTATVADRLVAVDASGRVTGRVSAKGAGSGRVVAAERGQVVAYRTGGRSTLRAEIAGEGTKPWTAPAAILGIAALAGAAPKVAVATVRGIHLEGGADDAAAWALADDEVCGVAATDGGGVVAATRAGDLVWVDAGGRIAARREAVGSCGPVLAVPGGGEVLIGSPEVAAAVLGRFWNGGWGVALIAPDGRIVLLDAASGALRGQAWWPGVGSLAAGDLDGDGVDELAVGAGRRLTLVGLESRDRR